MLVRCTEDCYADKYYRKGWEGEYDGPAHPCLVKVDARRGPRERKAERPEETEFTLDGYPAPAETAKKKGAHGK